MNMFRYIIELYSNKNPIKTYSDKDNKIINHDKYIQLLGFTKGTNNQKIISFYDLSTVEDLSLIKNYRPVFLRRDGIPKILTSLVKSIKKEKL